MKQPKTIPMIIEADGREWPLRRVRGHWMYERHAGVGGTGAYKEACRLIQERGGRVERRPNPLYRPPSLADLLGTALGGK